MPFGENLSKQERYRAYLQSQASPHQGASLSLSAGMSVEQMNHELDEFSKSAAIFRPMTNVMANRFRSSNSDATAAQLEPPREGLYQPGPSMTVREAEEKREAEEEERKRLEEESRTPAQNAARSGMFGKMTRLRQDWYPARLLLKRFELKDPYPDRIELIPEKRDERAPSGEVDPFANREIDIRKGSSKVTWMKHKSTIEALASEHARADGKVATPEVDAGAVKSETPVGANAIPSIDQVGLGDDPTQGRDTLTYVKPAIDIFKAVFASDDEDSDADEDAHASAKAGEPAAPSTKKALVFTPGEGVQSIIRPTFVAKSKREAEQGGGPEGDKGSNKKRKKDKKKKGEAKHTLSFGLDDEGDESMDVMPASKPTAVRPKAADLF